METSSALAVHKPRLHSRQSLRNTRITYSSSSATTLSRPSTPMHSRQRRQLSRLASRANIGRCTTKSTPNKIRGSHSMAQNAPTTSSPLHRGLALMLTASRPTSLRPTAQVPGLRKRSPSINPWLVPKMPPVPHRLFSLMARM